MELNPVVADATTSVWAQIQSGANWCGRQVQCLGKTIADYAIRTYNWAKPFFQAVGRFFVEQFDKGKDFVLQNKQLSMAVGATAAVVAIGVLSGAYIFGCLGGEKEAAKAQQPA